MEICIFGASSDHLDPVYYEEAEKLGRLAAHSGHRIIFGGGADGLMGACARGVLAGGGKVLGIAPKLFDEPGILLPESTEIIFTSSMAERKERMLSIGDAFISLPGGIGTMDEFFETITLKQLGLLNKPLALLNTMGFYDLLLSFLKEMAQKGFMSENCLALLRVCNTPQDALAAALQPDSFSGNVRRLEDYNNK